MDGPSGISDQEFGRFRDLIYQIAGIQLSDAKKVLLVGRLSRRLKHYGLSTFAQYYQLVTSPQESRELQTMVDLLTTNETYFFREPKHFEFLQEQILPGHPRGRPFRVWSAACSSGEEPYSLAMLLDDRLGDAGWEVLASDISTQVLDKARRGLYGVNRIELMPGEYLRRYCLRGIGAQEGLLLLQQSGQKATRSRQLEQASQHIAQLNQQLLQLMQNGQTATELLLSNDGTAGSDGSFSRYAPYVLSANPAFDFLAVYTAPPRQRDAKLLMVNRNMWFHRPGLSKPVPTLVH